MLDWCGNLSITPASKSRTETPWNKQARKLAILPSSRLAWENGRATEANSWRQSRALVYIGTHVHTCSYEHTGVPPHMQTHMHTIHTKTWKGDPRISKLQNSVLMRRILRAWGEQKVPERLSTRELMVQSRTRNKDGCSRPDRKTSQGCSLLFSLMKLKR